MGVFEGRKTLPPQALWIFRITEDPPPTMNTSSKCPKTTTTDPAVDAAKERLRHVISSGAGSKHHLQVALRLLNSDEGRQYSDKCDRCQAEGVLCWAKEDASGKRRKCVLCKRSAKPCSAAPQPPKSKNQRDASSTAPEQRVALTAAQLELLRQVVRNSEGMLDMLAPTVSDTLLPRMGFRMAQNTVEGAKGGIDELAKQMNEGGGGRVEVDGEAGFKAGEVDDEADEADVEGQLI